MIEPRLWIKALRVSFTAMALVVGASTASHAGPLNLSFDTIPVIDAGSLISNFNAATGAFSTVGNTWGINPDGSGRVTLTTPFKVQAIFSGGTVLSASLLIGTVDAPLLTTSDFSQFAYSASKGGSLEFLFNSATGSGVTNGTFDGGQVDVQITVSSTFTPQFTSSWGNVGETALVRDVATQSTPEPSSLLLISAGAAVWFIRRRREAGL